jgi:hypothetical protein
VTLNGTQTALEGDKLNPPRKDAGCEWCEAPSTCSFPITRRVTGKRNGRIQTGMRVYACSKHEGQARRMTAEPLSKS